MKKFLVVALLTLIVITPFHAFAQVDPDVTGIGSIGEPQAIKEIGTGCGVTFPLRFDFVGCIVSLLYSVAYIVTGWFPLVAGIFFNFIVYITLSGRFFAGPDIAPFIQSSWEIFRNLVNVVFIFILIYIGFRTILRMGTSNTYKLLGKVVLYAILINFSLVITKVVIDASHALAFGFYQAFPDATSLVSLFSFDGAKDLSMPFIKATNPVNLLTKGFDAVVTEGLASAPGVVGKVILLGVGGVFMNIVLGCILFAAAAIFLIRIVVLTFLMILSPLAFAAAILPESSKYFKKWWSTLLNNAFFAPIFLALFYMSARMIIVVTDFTSVEESFSGTIITVVVGFSIAIAFMVASIVISKTLSVYGAATTVNKLKSWNKRGRGAVARRTIGRAAHTVADSDRALQLKKRAPRLGALALKPFEYAAGEKFGGKIGYKQELAQQRKKQEKTFEDLGKGREKTEIMTDLKGEPVETGKMRKETKVVEKEVEREVGTGLYDKEGKEIKTTVKEMKKEEVTKLVPEEVKISKEQKVYLDKLKERRSRVSPASAFGFKKEYGISQLDKKTVKELVKNKGKKSRSKIEEAFDDELAAQKEEEGGGGVGEEGGGATSDEETKT